MPADSKTPPSPPPSLPPLREVIARHGLSARRHLGQHFLLDTNLLKRIVRAAEETTPAHFPNGAVSALAAATVIEIGPGPGGLTRHLLDTPAARLIAIEKDLRCMGAIEELAMAYKDTPGAPRLQLIAGDALAVDFSRLGTPPRHVVANLPYNVAMPLILLWTARPEDFCRLTLMVQKEMAERLAAGPGSRSYGRPSVMVQWRWQVTPLFDVPPRAFVPPPRVTSTVLRLTPLAAPVAAANPAVLEKVVAAAFGQRRKMLRAALKTLSPDPGALLAAAGIEPTQRAEDLSIKAYCALARAFVAGA